MEQTWVMTWDVWDMRRMRRMGMGAMRRMGIGCVDGMASRGAWDACLGCVSGMRSLDVMVVAYSTSLRIASAEFPWFREKPK